MSHITAKGRAKYQKYKVAAAERGLDLSKDKDLEHLTDLIEEDVREELRQEAKAKDLPITLMEVTYLRVIIHAAEIDLQRFSN